jgi:YYY domain-containing protein
VILLPGIETELLYVAAWLLAVTFISFSIWPYLRRTFGEYAFPISMTAGLLLFTFISWYCGLAGLPIVLSVIPFAALFVFALSKGAYTWDRIRAQGNWYLVFLVFFLAMLEVRYLNPSISYAEKFMDHAFIASVIRNPVIPPLDPWFAGGTLNVYYYLGYWTFGAFGIITGVPSNIVFNLALPTVFGLAACSIYALGHFLLPRFRWLPLGTLVLVNPSFIYQVLLGKEWGSVLWDSTRTIPNTINEYPLFSFVWGDVHPHVISICNQVFLIFLLVFAWSKWNSLDTRARWVTILLAALSLGSMPLINTWDVLIYAPLTLLAGMLIWYRTLGIAGDAGATLPSRIRKRVSGLVSGLVASMSAARERLPVSIVDIPVSFLLLVPFIAVAAYLPFYFQMRTTGIQGIGTVLAPTGPVEFLLVNGFFIIFILAYIAGEIRSRPYLLLIPIPVALAGYPAAAIVFLPFVFLLAKKNKTSAEILAIAGLSILLFCEFLYLKDNMGETYYRMNTIFKFYLAAWLLLGISGFAMLAQVLDRSLGGISLSRQAVTAGKIIAIVILLALPFATPFAPMYPGHTLDGMAYLDASHPGDAEAIAWLRALEGNITIVEAVGGDYTYSARVSSFTGIPTIIGWPFHEYMWRNDTSAWYGARVSDVKAIYENPSKTAPVMKRYNASLLYVGDTERETYRVNVSSPYLTPVYDRGGVQIYRLTGYIPETRDNA